MAILVGQVVEGRCVTNNLRLRGRVTLVVEPERLSGDSSPRYRIEDVEFIDQPQWPKRESAIVFA